MLFESTKTLKFRTKIDAPTVILNNFEKRIPIIFKFHIKIKNVYITTMEIGSGIDVGQHSKGTGYFQPHFFR